MTWTLWRCRSCSVVRAFFTHGRPQTSCSACGFDGSQLDGRPYEKVTELVEAENGGNTCNVGTGSDEDDGLRTDGGTSDSAREQKILSLIDETTGYTIPDLSKKTGLRKREVQESLASLMERGMITSTPDWEYRRSRRTGSEPSEK